MQDYADLATEDTCSVCDYVAEQEIFTYQGVSAFTCDMCGEVTEWSAQEQADRELDFYL